MGKANLIITQQVVLLNRYSQCVTRPRVAETVTRDEKSLITGFACEMVFWSITVAQSRNESGAVQRNLCLRQTATLKATELNTSATVLFLTNVRSGPQNPESRSRILCPLNWNWQRCPPASQRVRLITLAAFFILRRDTLVSPQKIPSFLPTVCHFIFSLSFPFILHFFFS
jgi:hypothetical protein